MCPQITVLIAAYLTTIRSKRVTLTALDIRTLGSAMAIMRDHNPEYLPKLDEGQWLNGSVLAVRPDGLRKAKQTSIRAQYLRMKDRATEKH